ncbi:MAG: putative glycoside hydrolase [Candidatus Paceibacterota bacterium]|jgi:hypothetical protein
MSKKGVLIAVGAIVIVVAVALFFGGHRVISGSHYPIDAGTVGTSSASMDASGTSGSTTKQSGVLSDDLAQQPLRNPPAIIRAAYLTSWSAGVPSRVDEIIRLAGQGTINAVVIDIKDYSGYIAYRVTDPALTRYETVQVRIPRINTLIKKFHDAGIYVIARITAFQDPVFAQTQPAFAIHSSTKAHATSSLDFSDPKTIWTDDRDLAWIDPASHGAWAYLAAIGKDAVGRGFDEINFDYVRFPSNGSLTSMVFPAWNKNEEKHLVIRDFFKYLRDQLPQATLSVDLFGFVTVRADDLGIGQQIEDALAYADYVCPMAYPSLYDSGFLGYKNPAQYPYEVVRYSMEGGLARLVALANGTTTPANWYTTSSSSHVPALDEATMKKMSSYGKLRPWLQAFDFHAVYTGAMVEKEIQATKDALGSAYAGYLLWDPTNKYSMLP